MTKITYVFTYADYTWLGCVIESISLINEQKSLKLSDQAKKLKVQIWSSVVNILVIEGKHLADKDGASLMKPYLRLRSVKYSLFRLGVNSKLFLYSFELGIHHSLKKKAGKWKVQDKISDTKLRLD